MDTQRIIVLTTEELDIHYNLLSETGIKSTTVDKAKDIKFFKLTPDNKCLVWAKCNEIGICALNQTNNSLESQIKFYSLKGVQLARFSPLGTYIWFWRSLVSTTDASDNFHVFKVDVNDTCDPLKPIYSSKMRSYLNCDLHWFNDESKCCQFSPNLIRVFSHSTVPFETTEDTKIPGLVAMSAAFPYLVYCVDSDNSDMPSFFKLHKYPYIGSNCLANKAYRDMKDFAFHWNNKGNVVLITCTRKNEGKTGSYYGKQEVYLLGYRGESLQIDIDKDAILYDIGWYPTSNKFVLVHGSNPSIVSIYNDKGDELTKLSTGPYNKIFINPFESLACLCGIGNVKGYTGIFHLTSSKCLTLMNTPTATDVYWMSDGLHMIYATLSPKMNLDNGYIIYDYNGNLVNTFQVSSNNGSQNTNLLHIESIHVGSPLEAPHIVMPSIITDLRTIIKSTAYVPTASRCNLDQTAKETYSKRSKKNKNKIGTKSS